MEIAWTPREYNIRQRNIVCSGTDEGAEWNVGDQDKAVNSFPPTDRWTN